MGGFQSSLFSKAPADCITFLLSGWKLDHSGKFISAMIFTFTLAVVSEGMAVGQNHVRNYYLVGKSKHQRKSIMTLLYGLQQLVGWILMLISMIFSVELFASVLLGLMLGKLLFPLEQTKAPQHQTLTTRLSDAEVGDGADQGNRRSNNVLLQNGVSNDGISATSVRRRRRWPFHLLIGSFSLCLFHHGSWFCRPVFLRDECLFKTKNTILISVSIKRQHYEIRGKNLL